ncbi:MAG TPA: sulfotransferase [Longimicrobium sp.]|nr:sulfotransferase [Longimicrobium sp.]
MSLQAIESIQLLDDPSGRIRASRLVAPQAGGQMNPFAFSLRGWVVGASAPVRQVELVHGTREVAALPLSRPNLEVAREVGAGLAPVGRTAFRSRLLALRALRRMGWLGMAEPGAARRLLHPDVLFNGFDATVPLLGLPERCTLRLQARLDGGAAVPLADIHVRRPRLSPGGYAPRYRPLMVTSIGRSGSTWFQHVISQHPQVAAYRTHGYEVTAAQQLARLAIGATAQSPYTESFFAKKGFTDLVQSLPGGAEPVRRLVELVGSGVEDLVQQALRSVDRFYALADTLDGREPAGDGETRYFTEKNLRPEWFFWEAYSGAKEIFLVRDFRDVICSSLAANAKWGKRFFGRSAVGSDRDYIFHRAGMARPWILEPWKERAGRAHLVHYEELILDPERALAPALDYLELDSSPSVVRAMLARAEEKQDRRGRDRHMTSGDARGSIGRWKTDLAPDLVEACNEAFAEFYAAFYAAAPASAAAPAAAL